MLDRTSPGPSDRSSVRVLVVDADEGIRAFLRMALSDEGYEVMAFGQVRSGLVLVQTFQPHIILLDIFSSAASEQIFLDAYRRMPGPHIPIIGMTTDRVVDGAVQR